MARKVIETPEIGVVGVVPALMVEPPAALTVVLFTEDGAVSVKSRTPVLFSSLDSSGLAIGLYARDTLGSRYLFVSDNRKQFARQEVLHIRPLGLNVDGGKLPFDGIDTACKVQELVSGKRRSCNRVCHQIGITGCD